jgi:crossover junction endodeoxyribonuclease RuvC
MPASPPRTRRVLGIDPGLRVTGYGLIEIRGNTLVYIASGCIRATGTSLPTRLGVIARDLAFVIAEMRPDEVAVEKVFVNVNPNSTLLLGQARGAQSRRPCWPDCRSANTRRVRSSRRSSARAAR